MTASTLGPYQIRAVPANWQASRQAPTSYTEKVFLLYNDANDQKSYVVSSVDIGLQVSTRTTATTFHRFQRARA